MSMINVHHARGRSRHLDPDVCGEPRARPLAVCANFGAKFGSMLATLTWLSACTGTGNSSAEAELSATERGGAKAEASDNQAGAGADKADTAARAGAAGPAEADDHDKHASENQNGKGEDGATTKPERRYPDACDERRASWTQPCTQDPDPCNLKSGFPGDEYCLLPPPPGQGIQIHFGPKSYTDEKEVARYLIQPGEEFNSYAWVNVPTTEDKFFAYVKISMRPGSHHLINSVVPGQHDEGFLPQGTSCEGEPGAISFPGTQNLITESPPQGIEAPENVGIGRSLPGNSSLCQNYHRYNNTDKPALNEIWYNIWFVDEAEVTQKASGVTVVAGPWRPIQPHSKEVLTTTTTINGDGRIISLFGHRHAATERFAAWLNDELIYDSWDWVDSRVFNYDSITQNPAPNPPMKADGASSGVLSVKRGDKVKIECHVNNTTDTALRFANELYTGEMCILFGSTVGVPISQIR